MDLKQTVKNYAKVQIVRQVMQLLPNFSLENLIRLVSLGERLVDDHRFKQYARGLREKFEQRHPAVLLARDIIQRLSPNCRNRLIENLFINAFLLGTDRRNKLRNQEGYRPPLLFVISPTMRCNLHCPGCYAGEYQQDFGLSFETVDRILTEAKELGIYFVTVSGGEVFIRPDIIDLWGKHNDMYFQVYTNGTLIDQDMAKRLERLGNVAPMISVEGFEKETDARRGKGVYKKIMAAMDNLREQGVVFGASITETRENIDLIASDELVDMLIEKGAMVIWYFQYIPIGRKPAVHLIPTPEQRDGLRRRLRYLRSTKPIFIGDFWNDGPYVGGCIAAGREYFHINANGDVEPCVFAHFAVDNIKDKSLKDVLNSDFFKSIRKQQPYRENLLTPCMIIDKPKVLRKAVLDSGAHPTHPGAETITTELADFLDNYSQQYHAIADRVWETEYRKTTSTEEKGDEQRQKVGESASVSYASV